MRYTLLLRTAALAIGPAEAFSRQQGSEACTMCAGGGALAERFGLRESEGAKRDTPEWEAPRKLVTSMPSQMAELFAQIAPEAEVIAVSLS